MVTIEITLDDISKGRARHPYYCALALAFQRAVPEADTVKIDHLLGRVILSWERYKHRSWTRDLQLPEEAIKFLGGEFAPTWYGRPRPLSFEFDVHI